MKLAYVDYYSQQSALYHKDPVTIPLAMRECGLEVVLVAINPLPGKLSLLDFECISLAEVTRTGWQAFGFDGVVFVSRLEASHTHHLESIKQAGLPLIIKTDSDGTWGYPLVPNYLRVRPLRQNLFVNLLRHLKWRTPSSILLKPKLRQVELADAVILESPAAVANAQKILAHWGMDTHASKLIFIPNLVPADEHRAPVATAAREPRIVLAARWEDAEVKNTVIMLQEISAIMQQLPTLQVDIVGSGISDALLHQYCAPELMQQGRLSLLKQLNYTQLQQRFARARIVMVPSRLESFCYVAAEALCAGASIVVTPIESLIYLAGKGKWGTVANGFSVNDLVQAVLDEWQLWEDGERDSLESSAYWNTELSGGRVGKQYIAALDNITSLKKALKKNKK